MKTIYVGFDNYSVNSNKETLKQMQDLLKYDLDVNGLNGEKIVWSDIYNEQNKNSLFSVIYQDRKIRKNNTMADRPPFLRASIYNGKVIRIEFYFGHDKLEKIYDFKSNTIEKDLILDDFVDDVEYDKDNVTDVLNINRIHLNLTKIEIKYLKIRNTVTIEQHQNDLSKAAIKEVSDSIFKTRKK